MAITKNQRIFDLAYGAKYTPGEISRILKGEPSTVGVEEVLANLANEPSSQISSSVVTENSPGGQTAQLFGNLKQVGNTARSGRSNGDYLGLSDLKDKVTGATTKLGVSVPILVRPGDVITKVGLCIGETAGATLAHHQAALYEGKGAKPVLLAESASSTAASIAKAEVFNYTLTSALTITEANAPNGFIYANYVIVGTTIPSLLCGVVEVKTSVQLKITGKETPLFLAATNKPAAEEGEKPEAKLETTITAIEFAPLILLT